jgi:hypothetical protein
MTTGYELGKGSGAYVIDLASPDGNAFFLATQARIWAKQLGWDLLSRTALSEEILAGDYVNAIVVFLNHFGSFARLINVPDDVYDDPRLDDWS